MRGGRSESSGSDGSFRQILDIFSPSARQPATKQSLPGHSLPAGVGMWQLGTTIAAHDAAIAGALARGGGGGILATPMRRCRGRGQQQQSTHGVFGRSQCMCQCSFSVRLSAQFGGIAAECQHREGQQLAALLQCQPGRQHGLIPSVTPCMTCPQYVMFTGVSVCMLLA